MSHEIKEATNFLSNFLFNKLPRRKVTLWAEQLSSALATKYQDHWFVDEPQKDANFRAIYVNVHGKTEQLISVAAESVGLEVADVLVHLPNQLTMSINPGDVSYRISDYGVVTSIFNGTPSAELSESPSKGISATSSPISVAMAEQQLKAGYASPMPADPNWVISAGVGGGDSPVFEINNANDLKFTVGSFAMTRFGTSKQKTNLAALKQIQRKAAATVASKAAAQGNGYVNNGQVPSGAQVPPPPFVAPGSNNMRAPPPPPTVSAAQLPPPPTNVYAGGRYPGMMMTGRPITGNTQYYGANSYVC